LQKFDRNICFLRKTPFFSPKLFDRKGLDLFEQKWHLTFRTNVTGPAKEFYLEKSWSHFWLGQAKRSGSHWTDSFDTHLKVTNIQLTSDPMYW
jgi:hypothetical protein